MFKINCRIVGDIEELKLVTCQIFDREYNGIDGFFEISNGEQREGYYHEKPLQEGELGGEWVNYWLNQLLDVLNHFLSGHLYMAIKEIETVNRWIEFTLEKEHVKIRVATDKEEVPRDIAITEIYEKFIYDSDFETSVSLEDFKKEVLRALEQFIADLKMINPELLNSRMVQELTEKASVNNSYQQLLKMNK